MPNPDFALVSLVAGPARFAGAAVHVPLHEIDRRAPHYGVERVDDVILHLRAAEVENELAAPGGWRAALEMQGPFGVHAVEIGVRIDHLGLDPEPELHPTRMHRF